MALNTAKNAGFITCAVYEATSKEEAKKQGKYTGRKPITSANFDKIYARWQNGG